ncbi:ester cyclase [Streptomyces mobaraensis NBRC 13819 = DSM 40847]|uniref:Putative ester cyclase n=1 Tax=Streptomyces mobaraensis (strain ATCC 29032 / DSM 40847 / JCM 4168 / NBRC 13819 / NCIMB 11159 / IPCR 16-22) TaxID=1223523 RepID=M3B5P6_STRM1|nr:ester cyclase [Streptomyces mobaraensis]EMF01318.1 putative ester cyclase [Streptomyces mobaraensis NBRC 13819 = DSM 40847]QTT77234.1 ester cyclase [Streptomyces mobaraensis NBRC 13819 = DSM 40847]
MDTNTARHPGKRLVADFLRAVEERRLGDLPRYLARDVVDHNKIIAGEPDEPGAAFEGIRRQLDAFGEFTVRTDGLLAEGDTVVARLTVGGRHTGEHPRMPRPTGRAFAVEQIWWFTVADGRISEIRAVSDRLGMFLQLGWDWPEAD